jgi:hypothetical protein
MLADRFFQKKQLMRRFALFVPMLGVRSFGSFGPGTAKELIRLSGRFVYSLLATFKLFLFICLQQPAGCWARQSKRATNEYMKQSNLREKLEVCSCLLSLYFVVFRKVERFTLCCLF